MAKLVLTFACLAVLVAVAVCVPKKECEPVCKKDVESPVICARLDRTKQCRRVRVCEMREANCRLDGKPKWAQVSVGLCSQIRGNTGAGECDLRPPCWRLACSKHESRDAKCYRTKDNHCRVRSPCQAKRHNCAHRNQQWKLVHNKLCHGMKSTDQAAKCHKSMHE